jgi:glycosyltransferase involved in cell wall biosynthesis
MKKNKKILIVTQYFWPERFKINDIAKGLLESGHEVTVLAGLPNYPEGTLFPGYSFFKGPFVENYEGIKVIRIPLITRGPKKGIRLALNYFSFMILATLLAPFIFFNKKLDDIFVYQLSPVTAALPALPIKWVTGAKIYFWVTDLWPETLEATNTVKSKWAIDLWGKLVTFLYKHSDKVLVTSKGFIPKIIKRGISSDKLIYWPQWGEELFANPKINDNFLNEGEIPKDSFIVMFAGNIGTSQSFDTIVSAAEMLKEKKQIKWVILGDGLHRKWVEQEVEKRRLNESFFLLGSRPLEAMPTYYSQSDVLLASLKEDPLFEITVPAKVQSYLPSGKPIIVSMDGEGAELINDAQAGISCKASNAKELAEAVERLYEMPNSERQKLGDNGKQYFFENFEREMLLSRLENIMDVQSNAEVR